MSLFTKQVGNYAVRLDDDKRSITVDPESGISTTKFFDVRPLAHSEFDNLNTEEDIVNWLK